MLTKARKGPGGLWYVTVDGKEYSFTRWGAERSLDVLSEIGDILGRPLGVLLGNMIAGAGMHTEVTADFAATLISKLLRKMKKNKPAVMAVIKSLTSGSEVFCRGKVVVFNDHYENDLWHMFRVAQAGLEVQYGSFFAAAQDAVGLSRVAAAQDSTPASATSTG